MRTADFDYELPPELIAQHPPARRDAARMLVLDPRAGAVMHATVAELPRYLDAGDLLVLNDTRVLPARLIGRRGDGGDAEVLLLRPVDADRHRWEALIRPRRRLEAGSRVQFESSALAVVVEERNVETAIVRLDGLADPLTEVRRIGQMPTPPYIKERLDDRERYQTIYARQEGSAAAPTAGLHFTPALLCAIAERGVRVAFVTLHVGLDTFRPVRVEDPTQHVIHREWYRLDDASAQAINETRRGGKRVVAVGTTCVRVLESAAVDGAVVAGEGWTGLLILPGHRFRVVDAMLTNFHLPRSTLLMLVSAFAGRDQVLAAYAEAIKQRYRFYSFGDCMFITSPHPALPRERAREEA
ncbi:MAG TPA: tRNA preQ1(34) S-adenosylmethionine ribosyltransferase-isomerase QueA [Candidatus Dormibacteraeota bacterium]|nr:tRNA preQ1(34) S-adenosylmethionine ribosyltransferase-isomerase QueA [Candidatus Dormibacteraeota bacterium]